MRLNPSLEVLLHLAIPSLDREQRLDGTVQPGGPILILRDIQVVGLRGQPELAAVGLERERHMVEDRLHPGRHLLVVIGVLDDPVRGALEDVDVLRLLGGRPQRLHGRAAGADQRHALAREVAPLPPRRSGAASASP